MNSNNEKRGTTEEESALEDLDAIAEIVENAIAELDTGDHYGLENSLQAIKERAQQWETEENKATSSGTVKENTISDLNAISKIVQNGLSEFNMGELDGLEGSLIAIKDRASVYKETSQ